MFAAIKWLIVTFIPPIEDFLYVVSFCCITTFPAADKTISDCSFFCNKQNNAHPLMHPWPTNQSNSLHHPHLIGYEIAMPFSMMMTSQRSLEPID